MKISNFLAVGAIVLLTSCSNSDSQTAQDRMKTTPTASATMETMATNSAGTGIVKVVKTEAEWKKQLTPQQFNILREEGTEAPFVSNKYHNFKGHGVYGCAGCGLELFSSDAKFDSGTGWPSFWQPIAANHVEEKVDAGAFGDRTEIVCARCDGHLGHVFEDGPKPTGLRYCMNSVALNFVKK